MAPRRKHRFWRLLRIYFRRFRIIVWTCILIVLGMLLYVNQIGLPGFIKNPILQKLRARGIDLQFSRLRLRWHQGLVAENVRFGQATERLHPQITASQVQVQLNYRALRRLQIQVDSLTLRQGCVVWPVPDETHTNRELSIQNIQTDLRLLPGDEWQLEHFTAGLAGARIQLSGAVTNASAVRDWKFLHAERASPAGQWQNRLRSLADTLEKIQFSSTPDLRLDVRGDARDPLSFRVRLMVNTPGAETPWGSVTDGKFSVHVFPGPSNDFSRVEVSLEAANAKTEWAAATNLHLTVQLVSLAAETNLVNCDLVLTAGSAETKWASATNTLFKAQWVHALTNPVPIRGHGELTCERANTEWCRARELKLQGQLGPPEGAPAPDASWAWWGELAPYALDLQLRALDFERENLLVASLACEGRWRAPDLAVTNLQAELYDGRLNAGARLNAATRELNVNMTSNFDPHKVEQVLTAGARRWLSQFTWNAPPQVEGAVSLVLPAWTNREPDWRAEVQPGLRIAGKFNILHGGTFRGVTARAAQSSFIYSNMAWRLPDLVAIRPEGRIEAEHSSSDRTKDFYWRFRSTIDPMAMRPLLETNQQRGLDLFKFPQPPLVEAEVWGRWRDEERLGMKGRVSLTNFSFRADRADSLNTAVSYTNHTLTFSAPQARRGPELFSAAGVLVDFDAQKVFLTNGFSTGDPMFVARAIGPHVIRAIEPYQFLTPPTAYVHGVIPIKRDEDADLYFQIDGGPFHWWKFNIPHISGEVHWGGRHLSITDVNADFYGGRLAGSAGFDFTPQGAEYHFIAKARNTDLQYLMTDLSTKTNRLEGRLDASLVIKRGNLSKTNDFDGYGTASLRDGLIWTIPIFGVFSPALDTLVPGLGSSRATSGSGTFMITNGVLLSEDAEIRSAAMRLDYRGTVDMEGRVNARVEAQVLRDVWLIGPIVSTVLWPFAKVFEYKVGGTLAQPKTELLYFGKPPASSPPGSTPAQTAPEKPPDNLSNAPPVAPKAQ
jgi:hypothetical protein